jgi:acetamidase/formamidase
MARVGKAGRVVIQTEDAFESGIRTEEDLPGKALATAKFLNPQTGPVYVEGAEPGNTLAVRLEEIEPARDYAVSCFRAHAWTVRRKHGRARREAGQHGLSAGLQRGGALLYRGLPRPPGAG